MHPQTSNEHQHSPAGNGNGRRGGFVFTSRPLPAYDAPDQIMRRGSCNAAMTHLDERALEDLRLTVLTLLREDLERRTANPVNLDELDPRAVARNATATLLTHPEIAEAPPHALERRIEILRSLFSDRPSKMKREFAEKVRQNVQRILDPCIEQLRCQAESAPYGLSPILSDATASLDGIIYPAPDTKAYPQFRYAVQAKMQIEHDGSSLPQRICVRVIAGLAKHAAEDFDRCLAAFAQQVANDAIRSAVENARPTIEELRRVTAEVRTSYENVARCLEEERTQGYRRHAISESSNLLRLDGPSEQDLLSCLMDKLGSQNRRELATRLIEKLTDRLNGLAKCRYPFIAVPAGTTTLLSRISPSDIAATLRELLRESIGDASSVYAAVRAAGPGHVVRQLYEKSAPLCRLRSRDRAVFKVETAKKMVVRLPLPLGAEDHQTHQDLRDAFGRIPNTECVEAPPGEREITVVRTILGYPYAIDSNSETLLTYYATAEDVRHRPHLFGVLPGSETGLPLAELKRVFEVRGDT